MPKPRENRLAKNLWWDEALSLVHGCSPVSAGCRHCWAAAASHMRASNPNPAVAARNAGLTEVGPEGTWFNGTVRTDEEALLKPLRRRTPTMYAVWNDLFHPSVPDEFRDRAFAVFALCPQHTFLVLTKRAGAMAEYVNESGRDEAVADASIRCQPWRGKHKQFRGFTKRRGFGQRVLWPLPNVWLGVTAEDQAAADERIPGLLRTPAAVRFVSAEPLLGPLDLTRVRMPHGDRGNVLDCRVSDLAKRCGIDKLNGIDWIIVGGESGPRARPMHPDWARDLRDQCDAAGVPFFFKQWGEYCAGCQLPPDGGLVLSTAHSLCFDECGEIGGRPIPEECGGIRVWRVGKKAAGHTLDGQIWQQFPDPPKGASDGLG